MGAAAIPLVAAGAGAGVGYAVAGTATGALMGAGIGSALGSGYTQYEASKEAKENLKEAEAAAQAQLDFEKKRYANWDKRFSPLAEDLHSYFLHSSPDSIQAQLSSNLMGLGGSIEQSVAQNMARRNLLNSGLQKRQEYLAKSNLKTELAETPVTAMDEYNKRLKAFVGLGLGNKVSLDNALTNSNVALINSLFASSRQNTLTAQMAGQSLVNSAGAIGYILGRQANTKPLPQPVASPQVTVDSMFRYS